MTESERWQWHAGVYAFRRVSLGLSADERTSPCDPDGKWFDALLVDTAEGRLRGHRDQARRRRQAVRDDEMQRGGRAICEKWARGRGFADFAAAEAAGYGHADVVDAIFAAATSERLNQMPHVSALLGVTAREFSPSRERLAADRAALGLDAEPHDAEVQP